MKKKQIQLIFSGIIIAIALLAIFVIKLDSLKNELVSVYNFNQSEIIKDRNNVIIKIKENKKGYYTEYIDELPKNFTKDLLAQEDRSFYIHPGINIKRTIEMIFDKIVLNKKIPSSTITQQLSKILLNKENERTIKNKLKEYVYTLSLEIFLKKDEILKMYENSIYFGNNIQGIKLASKYYYGTNPDSLTNDQIISLLKTIPNPTYLNPFKLQKINQKVLDIDYIKNKQIDFKKYLEKDSYFEIESIEPKNIDTINPIKTITIDNTLTENLREILKRNLNKLSEKKATNGAIIVLKYPENEVLSIVGSIDPKSNENAAKINMAIEERQIGSTIKPFIYAKGFEKNLRPYTEVEDKEYKYLINDGFAFYPKNYDYQYRGNVNLHYSLSNSLNVPTVKVLEYAGIDNFYDFLTKDLNFSPAQNIENYELGIALGGLEMDLFTLSYYYSIFSNNGVLKPLNLFNNSYINLDSTNFSQSKKVIDNKYIELVNKILSDRATSMDQFGSISDLNLKGVNYAVKTGTSREFHDSYTIGFTKDFLVAVWVGNAENQAMENVSGQTGAGKIWNEAMNLIINSEYNKNNKFDFKDIKEFKTGESIEYGLENDNYDEYKKLLKDSSLILEPHNDDEFQFEKNMTISLKSNQIVDWYINNKFLETKNESLLQDLKEGAYIIKAISKEQIQEIKIYINKD